MVAGGAPWGCPARAFEEGDHEFQAEADGVHRLLGAWLLVPAAAGAQSASEAAKIKRLERQTESVWRQHNMVNDIGTAFATTPYPLSDEMIPSYA